MDKLQDCLSGGAGGGQAELAYNQLWKRLVYRFRFFEDPEDLASETIYRTLINLHNEKVDLSKNPLGYIYTVARNVELENFRRRKRFVQLEEGFREPLAETQANGFPEERFQIVEKCLDELPAKDKQLYLEYMLTPESISDNEAREILSKKWNITKNYLRVKIFRIKNSLHDCAKQKLEEEQ